MTNEQKQSIIDTLGNHYSIRIIKWLTNTKNIFNENGLPFSSASIRQIVNGNQPNIEVEIAIAELVAETRKKINRKNKILK